MDLDSWNLPSFGYFDADLGEPVVADMTIIGMAVYISADNNYMSGLTPDAHTGLYTSLVRGSLRTAGEVQHELPDGDQLDGRA
jgi:hypothetical protein